MFHRLSPNPLPLVAAMEGLHQYFTTWDWIVLFGYLGLTTWVGHLFRGSQASIRDFFLGGRSLPWPAVSGSIIATEISGVTFIGIPGMVYALNGNFTYLQWALGSIIARIIVGLFFVRYFYQQEIFSPYDFMGRQLGKGVKVLATIIFSVGSILGQSVRVLVAALALRVVTPFPFWVCILIIGVFAIGWTLMGGMRTVIWTDVMQFFLFTFGGLFALFWIVGSLDGGWGQFWEVASSGRGSEAFLDKGTAESPNKFFILDASREKELGFTLWVAIFAVPFLNLNAFGVDQLNAQRMFCCRSESDARKAIIWSSVGQLLTILMLLVGAGLFVHYRLNPPGPSETALFDENKDLVFPAWIVTNIPVGIRGLILAAVFAAAISSLDSILAALSQTTLSVFYDPEKTAGSQSNDSLVVTSRFLVVGWGFFLTLFAIFLDRMRGDINMVNLAFGMIAYTTGPLLGLFLASVWCKRASVVGLALGCLLSFLLVLMMRTDLATVLVNTKIATPETIASWGFLDLKDGKLVAKLHYAWLWPVTTLITLVLGCSIPRKASGG